MPVQIGQKPLANFDDPLGILSDCHRRIESFLAALLTLARERQGAELDRRDRASLGSALEYFRISAPRHTADEEESLFPRMRASEHAAKSLRAIEALEADHVTADRAHRQIDRLGTRWLDQGRLDEPDAAQMRQLLETLTRLYTRHIDIEDHELFPIARRTLPAHDVAAISQEMIGRRGLGG